MFTLLLYLAVNVVISFLLEKRKLHWATVAHAAAFTVLFILMLFAQDAPIIQTALKNVVGEQMFIDMNATMTTDGVVHIGPTMVIEMIMPILVLVICAIAAIEVVNTIKRAGCREFKRLPASRKLFSLVPQRQEGSNRIYLTNCVIRC